MLERVSEIKQKKLGIPILLFLYKKGNYKREINEFKEKINEEIVNQDLQKSKEILRENWHLLSEDMKELLKLVL